MPSINEYLVYGLIADQVDNTILADMPANTIKGNNSGSAADPQDLTVSDVTTMLGTATQSGVQDCSYTYAADTGSADTYAITVSPAPSAYAAGQIFIFKATNANTGASTLNVNSLGAKSIVKRSATALAANDILAGAIIVCQYDGTNMQMTSQLGNSPSGSGDMVLADIQTVTGAKTFGTIGGAVGKFILAGSTSGSTILNAAAVAGSTTVTLPGATDTLMGKATTDEMTNKTFDADGTGNSLTNVEDANIKSGAAIDAAKIADGSVSNTEYQYLNGVTSALQTQIDAKGTGDALVANPLSQFAATTSAQLAGVLSDETGSGAAVFATSPTLVTPALGTPASGDLSNCTNLDVGGVATASNLLLGNISVILNDTVGAQVYVPVDYDCTIEQVTMFTLSDTGSVTGSAVVDIWKDTYANYPPTDADSITASATPTISSGIKTQDSTLTGWTTSITAGDILAFNLDSITTATKVAISLKVKKAA